jgi:hypothetical protein
VEAFRPARGYELIARNGYIASDSSRGGGCVVYSSR